MGEGAGKTPEVVGGSVFAEGGDEARAKDAGVEDYMVGRSTTGLAGAGRGDG